MKLELDFEISEEQAEQFAAELFYSSNLIEDIKQSVAHSLKICESYKGKKREYYIPFVCFIECGDTSCPFHKIKYRQHRQRYIAEHEEGKAQRNKSNSSNETLNVSDKKNVRSPLCFMRNGNATNTNENSQGGSKYESNLTTGRRV